MKHKQLFLAIFFVAISASMSHAQLVLPQPSPAASVMQVVGLTEIKIDYSSPAAKGRKVWGDLVPYDKIWRTGANRPTKISFNDDVIIGGKKIAKGSYTLLSIPSANEWTIILNTDSKGNGAFSYLETDDVVRFTVKAETLPTHQERFTFAISAEDGVTGTVSFMWEKTKVSFPITTDPITKAKGNIERGLAGNWYEYASAADYAVENKLDLDQAMKWADFSIALQEHFFNRWVKAKIYAAKGDKKNAIALANEAKKIGEANPSNFYDSYKNEISDSITKWGK